MYKRLKITFNAPITLSFVIVCFAATLLGIISNGRITQSIFMTYHTRLNNPMTYIINAYRNIFYNQTMVELKPLFVVFIISVIICVIGYAIYNKLQKGFAEQL